jgi:hypothetical protein
MGGELKMSDLINHPPYYNRGKIEVIDAIEDWGLGFHEANVVKYIARAKHKGSELENLKKAQWYLNRLVLNRLVPAENVAPKPESIPERREHTYCECDDSWVVVSTQNNSPYVNCICVRCEKPVTGR